MRAARIFAGQVAVIALVLTGCTGDGKMVAKDLALTDAKQQVDAELTIPLPQSFIPTKAIDRQASWGAQARSIEAAFSAPPIAVNELLVQLHASRTGLYRDTSNCPASSKVPAATVPPDSSVLSAWYDRGVFDRCQPVERWTIPANGLRNAKSAGAVYVQPGAVVVQAGQQNPLSTVLVSISTA